MLQSGGLGIASWCLVRRMESNSSFPFCYGFIRHRISDVSSFFQLTPYAQAPSACTLKSLGSKPPGANWRESSGPFPCYMCQKFRVLTSREQKLAVVMKSSLNGLAQWHVMLTGKQVSGLGGVLNLHSSGFQGNRVFHFRTSRWRISISRRRWAQCYTT